MNSNSIFDYDIITSVLPISATYIELRISFEKEILTKKTYYEKENRSEFWFSFLIIIIIDDFNFLLVQYGIAVNYVGAGTNATLTTDGYNNIQTNSLYIPRSGNFYGGSFHNQASYGSLWSGTTNSGTNAYYLLYFSSLVNPADSNNRQTGFPVRCICQKISQSKN